MAVHNPEIEVRNTNRLNLFRREEEEIKHSSRLLGRLSPGSGLRFAPASGNDDYRPGNIMGEMISEALAQGHKPVYNVSSLNGPYAPPREQPQLEPQESLGVESLINRYVGRVRGYG